MSGLTDGQTCSLRSPRFCAKMAIGEPRLEIGRSECECANPRALFCLEQGSAACQSKGTSIKDVRKLLGFFYPIRAIPLVRIWNCLYYKILATSLITSTFP